MQYFSVRHFFAVGTFAVLAAVCFYGYTTHANPVLMSQDNYLTLSYNGRHTFWAARIGDRGGVMAYQEFAKIVDGLSRSEQHDNGHIFGDALYETEDIDGIAACDGRFVHACFHAVMIRALLTNGLGYAPKLFKVCKEATADAGSCEHGIGHGILGVISGGVYSLTDLTKALALCDSLSLERGPAQGCGRGVFMEYDLHSMNTGTTSGRVFRSDELFEPCASLPRKYAGACVYMQPRWWMEVHPDRADNLSMAKKMGRWCTEMSHGDSQVLKDCISGIGHTITLLIDEEPSRTAVICSTATANPDYQLLCQTKSAERLMSYFPVKVALKACDGLPDAQSRVCTQTTLKDTEKIRADMEKYGLVDNTFE